MQQVFGRITPISSWHAIGDAGRIRQVLRMWDRLLIHRHLAELPDDDQLYWSLHEVLRGREDNRAKLLWQPGAAYAVVAIDLSRLRELCIALHWLSDALKDDHERKYTEVDGYWVVLEDVDDPPCTDLGDAKYTYEAIAEILTAAYERLAVEDL